MAESDATWADYRRMWVKRLAAASVYYRNKIPKLRAKAVADGDVPWRIIRYQRVIDFSEVPYPIFADSVTPPEVFRRHLEYLKRECNVIPLETLFQLISTQQHIPSNTVAITLDGGWRDTYTHAFPHLAHFQLPATVFIATSFVGTDNIFWPHKLLIYMDVFRRAKAPFPKFSFLTKEFYEIYNDVTENDEINNVNIELLVEAFQQAEPKHRFMALEVLGTVVQEMGLIPTYRNYMTWDEIRELTKHNISIGTFGHLHLHPKEVALEELAVDLQAAYSIFHKEGVIPNKVYAYPRAQIPKGSRALLYKVGVRHAVTYGPNELPISRPERIDLLSRVNMYLGVSYCPEVFACRLWDINVWGQSFSNF